MKNLPKALPCVLAAAILADLLGCGIRIGDPGPRGEVGVKVQGDAILLRVQPCDADALVQSVALRATTGKPGKDGDLLWQIEAGNGSLLRNFELGKTPTGFAETVKLARIEPNTTYVAIVSLVSVRLELSTAFVPVSLQESLWEVSSGRKLTNDELRELRPCS
jgi:hypothetical protein